MLVLSRKIEQSIIIQGTDGDVTVMLLSVEHDRAKIGIVAPDDVVILREELAGRAPAVTPQPLRPRPARTTAASVPVPLAGNLALKP